MTFTSNSIWHEPKYVNPKLPAGVVISNLKNQKLEKLMITWKEGAVQLYRGDKLVKEITNFRPVGIKDNNKMPSKSSWCWEDEFRTITDLNNKNLTITLPFRADRAKYYTYYVGIRPVKFLEMYNACMMKAFIPQDLRKEAESFCRERLGRFNSVTTGILINNSDFFRQMKSDGLSHMIPFFLKTTCRGLQKPMSVSLFRKEVGKGVWKSLLKNSPSRNKLIAHNIHNRHYDGWHYNTDYKTIISHLNKLPSGMIPRNTLQEVPELESVPLFRRMRILGDRTKQSNIGRYISDSKRMTEQLGRKMPKGNSSWNFDQWESYHEKVTELVNLKKYSKDKLQWLKPYSTQFRSENYTAIILDNAFDIKMEGETMRHCVASYSGQVAAGKYLVIGLRNIKGGRYSTLGLYVNEKGFTFSQHYKQCNASVDCNEAKLFAEEIVKALNKEYRKINKVKEE